MASRFLSVGVVLVALALPTTANAAGTVSGGPAKVAGGYTVTVQGTDGAKDSFSVSIVQGKATRGQTDHLSFSRGVRVTVRSRSASIKGSLGRHGSVDLRLRDARKVKGKLPEGCKGSTGTTYSGRLQGRLRLRLPNGKFVTIRSLPGSTFAGGKLDCQGRTPGTGDGGDGSGDGTGEPRLTLSQQVPGGTLVFSATKRTLDLTRILDEARDGRTTVSHVQRVHATGDRLLRPSSATQATVGGTGAFTGSGAFSGAAVTPTMATGPLTGNLRARIQGGPTVAIVGEQAILQDGAAG